MDSRRDQILSAAADLAAEDGMSALSVRGVARRTGIGASTLRHYFPTQRHLYTAVLQSTFDAQLEDRAITDATLPPAQRLVDCLSQFLPPDDEQALQLQHWLGMYSAALGPDGTAQARDLLTAFSGRANDRIRSWLTVLAEEGALRTPDQEHLLLVLNTTIDGLSLQFLTPGSTVTVASARQLLTETVTALVVSENR